MNDPQLNLIPQTKHKRQNCDLNRMHPTQMFVDSNPDLTFYWMDVMIWFDLAE